MKHRSWNVTTLFHPVKSLEVLVCIDSETLKEPLAFEVIKHSLFRLCGAGIYSFNLIVIAKELCKWCENFVRCNSETVRLSMDWLRATKFSNDRRGLKADSLFVILGEKAFDIYLIISGDSFILCGGMDEFLDRIAVSSISVRTHVRIVFATTQDVAKHNTTNITRKDYPEQFLRRLAQLTCGSFATVQFVCDHSACRHGCLVWDLGQFNYPEPRRSNNAKVFVHMLHDDSIMQVITSLSGKTYQALPMDHQQVLMNYIRMNPSDHLDQQEHWAKYLVDQRLVNGVNRYLRQTARECAHENSWWSDMNFTGVPGQSILLGRNVLARLPEDGHFYRGNIVELKGSFIWHMALIRFGPFRTTDRLPRCRSGTGKSCCNSYRYESVPMSELIDLDYALRHPIRTGDRVLVPNLWPKPRCASHQKEACPRIAHMRYLPATVVDGFEDRSVFHPDRYCGQTVSMITVALASNKYRLGCHPVEPGLAVWIPNTTYERLILEQLLPASERKWLRTHTFTPYVYPEQSAPGYPADGQQKKTSDRKAIPYETQLVKYLQLHYKPICQQFGYCDWGPPMDFLPE